MNMKLNVMNTLNKKGKKAYVDINQTLVSKYVKFHMTILNRTEIKSKCRDEFLLNPKID